MRACSICFAITEDDPCAICSGNRDAGTVCVVENSQDLMALERSNAWHGVYHVLEGAISPLSGIGPSALRIAELLERVEAGGISEVVIATNFTVEGEATALYLTKVLKPTRRQGDPPGPRHPAGKRYRVCGCGHGAVGAAGKKRIVGNYRPLFGQRFRINPHRRNA